MLDSLDTYGIISFLPYCPLTYWLIHFLRANIVSCFSTQWENRKGDSTSKIRFNQYFPLYQFRSDYLPYDIVKRPFRVQEEYKPRTGELELGTTYKKDYNAHEIQPVTLVRPLERKHTTGGKLDTIPTYQGNNKCHL